MHVTKFRENPEIPLEIIHSNKKKKKKSNGHERLKFLFQRQKKVTQSWWGVYVFAFVLACVGGFVVNLACKQGIPR